MPNSVAVERLRVYSDHDAAAIGHLLSSLSSSFSGVPVPQNLLQEIITSPHHEQLVARDTQGYIIGTATLSLTIGAGCGRKGWLEDFVTDPEVRHHGVGQALWDEMMVWCREHQVDLHFTSNPTREAAHRFYMKNSAQIRDTTVFEKKV